MLWIINYSRRNRSEISGFWKGGFRTSLGVSHFHEEPDRHRAHAHHRHSQHPVQHLGMALAPWLHGLGRWPVIRIEFPFADERSSLRNGRLAAQDRRQIVHRALRARIAKIE